MPTMPTIPEIERVEPVDWREKQLELRNKMEETVAQDNAQKKGRTSTILTAPGLDKKGASTTNKTLTGQVLGDTERTPNSRVLG